MNGAGIASWRSPAVWVLAVGVLDFALEQSIVVPALALFAAKFDASPARVTWILTSFLLALALSTALAGRLGDSFGRKRVLMVSLGMFAVGSITSALAGSIEVLIAGRVVQGLGAGVGPLAVALVRDQVTPADVPRAVGLIVGAGGLGGVLGLLAAGRLVEWFSTAAIFWALALVAAALLVAVAVVVRESTVRRAAIDWLGAMLLAAGPATLMLWISQGATWGWDSAKTIGVLCGGVALIAAFVARERAAPEPLVAFSRLTEPVIARANIAVFTVSIALFVAYVLVPLIAGYPSSTGYGLGLDTTQIGVLLLPGALANLVGGPIGGALLPRVGARVVATIGMVTAGGAYVVFLAFDYTEPLIALAMVLLGFAVGLVMSSIVCVVALSAQPGETGAMLGLNGVGRAIGASIGAQVATAILTAGPQLAPNVPAASGYPRAFAFAGVATLVALIAVAALPRRGEGMVIGPAQAAA